MIVSSRPALRAQARDSLRGNWGKAIGGLLLLSLITSVSLGILGMISESTRIAADIMSFIIGGMVGLGTIMFFLAIARRQNPPVTTVFHGFNYPVQAFVLYFLVCLYTILWSLLLIVPGIVAMYRYSLAYYIMADNPSIRPSEAINRSKDLMYGHKGRLFVLHLSFIGWMLLCIPTLGIGFLWLSPYISVTMAHFYDDLLRSRQEEHSNGQHSSYPEPPAPSSF